MSFTGTLGLTATLSMVDCDHMTAWSTGQLDNTTAGAGYACVEGQTTTGTAWAYTTVGTYGLGADLTDLTRRWANRPTWAEFCRRYWTYVATYVPTGQASQILAARRRVAVPRLHLLYAPREGRRLALPTSRAHRRLVRRLLSG